ncbi:MAG: alpha-amylase [Chloracidobacterium sp. CP2_5A]|nr:MAG: alpha-amylase [Chloracidobacterium sp. CP2_5A]
MLLYEINARLNGQRFAEITDAQLSRYAALGFDALWLMGVWAIGPEGVAMSKRYAPDFVGSPYAISDYQFNPELGDEADFGALRARARRHGLRLILDFIPNHFARDTPLIMTRPELFMHSNPEWRDEYGDDYYWHPSGRRLAHGKDPHFAGWNDTVQLDYTVAATRAYMRDALVRLATLCDGVRCDMAMLVLREQIHRQWYPRLPREVFDRVMPGEFWDEAITAAKRVNPDFTLIAEAYWDTELYLIGLGFDYAYDKRLLDCLVAQNAPFAVVERLRSVSEIFLKRTMRFVENHDEERAAARLSPLANRRAAALVCLLPGAALIHQGQMEGMTERIPVQRVWPLRHQEPDAALQSYFESLLQIARQPIFREGGYSPAESNVPRAVSFWRAYGTRVELILIPIGEEPASLPAAPCVTLPPPEYRADPRSARLPGLPERQLPVTAHSDCWQLDATMLAASLNKSPFARIVFDAQG